MADQGVRRTGSVCAILLGISYVVAGLTYLLLPAEQKGGTLLHNPEKYLSSLAQGSTLLVSNHLILGIGALLGLAVVVAVSDWARSLKAGWMMWIGSLGYLGFAVTAVDNFQIAALDPMRAHQFVRADPVTRTVIAVTNPIISIDPQMWLSFGLTGIWILAVSWLGFRTKSLPGLHGILGVVVAAAYLFIEIGSVLESQFLLLFAAGVGGLVIGPIWYAWLGLALWKSEGAPKS
jgi:hypothetical protein